MFAFTRLLITLCFLFSGATALIYQVIWIRTLGLMVGHSVVAVSIVVATFMGGLGIGARIAGPFATRLRHPLTAYGLLEALIGVYALATPVVFRVLQPLVAAVAQESRLLEGTLMAAVIVLLPPTLAMGATLPLLTGWYARDTATVGRDMGWLYAVNTTGAVLGAGLAGFVLLPGLGQPSSLRIAAGVNLGIGLGAALLGRRHPLGPSRGGDQETTASAQVAPSPARSAEEAADPVLAHAPATAVGSHTLLIAFALSGAAAMINQVAWTRSFSLFTGSSTYAFSLIVCAFIAGLAVGGHLFSRVVDRVIDRAGLLAAVNLGIALGAAVLIPVLGELPLWLLKPIAALESFTSVQAFLFGVLFLLVFVPTLMMGGTYAVATRALVGSAHDAPGMVGRAYAWNTAGAIVGSISTGLVLIPALQVRGALWGAVGLNLLAAALLLRRRSLLALVLPGVAVAGAFLSPAWNPRHMNLAPWLYARELAADPAALEAQRASGSILFHTEGVGAAVTVIGRSEGNRVLRINGKTDASTDVDRLAQSTLAHIPLLLAPEPAQVMTLGLGSGMSLASILEHPVDRVTVLELLPEVIEAAGYFKEILGAPLEDPRTEVRLGDGRQYLLYGGRKHDVIISHPTNLFVSGISTLFTAEAFQAMRGGLEPGGIAVVWIQGYLLLEEDFRTVLRTFLSVFPQASLWSAGPFEFFLVGHTAPLELSPARLEQRLAKMGSGSLARYSAIREVADLQRYYLMGPAALRAYAGEGRIHRDEDPFLEFTAPRGLYGAAGKLDPAAMLARRERLPVQGGDPGLEARLEAMRHGLPRLEQAALGADIGRLRSAMAVDPMHPFARDRLARLTYQEALRCFSRRDLEGAARHVDAVLDLEPDSQPALRLAAQLHAMRGAVEVGQAMLERARDRQPWNPYAHLALARFYARAGQAEAAARALEAVRRLDPDLPELSR